MDLFFTLNLVYPQAVLRDDGRALFLAISFHASVDVIATLVQACPQATLARVGRSGVGGVPLRRALENQSPIAVQALLCTSPEVVLDADARVHNTALHAALESGTPTIKLATLQLLLRMAPKLAVQRNRAGQTPLTLACRRWQSFHESVQREQQTLAQMQQQQQQEINPTAMRDFEAQGAGLLANIHILEGHCEQMWQLMVLLMQAAFCGTIAAVDHDGPLLPAAAAGAQQQPQHQVHNHDSDGNTDNNSEATVHASASSAQQPQQPPPPQPPARQQPIRFHVLHAAVSLHLPLRVVLHALELYVASDRRNYPWAHSALHYCILSTPFQHTPLHVHVPQQQHNEKNLLLEKEQCILKALQIYPEATQFPGAAGCLALHLAAQASRTVSVVVLQELWTHYPAALATLDPLWRLYPFQIAAVEKEQRAATATTTTAAEQQGVATTSQATNEDLMQLSAVFVLLKQCPDLIHLHL